MSELSASANTGSLVAVNPEADLLHVDVAEAYERGKVDINFFASLMLPMVMISPLPAFYVAIFRMLVNRTPEQMGRILRFALGLPRGHAKTTFIKILIAWFIAYDKIKFAAIVCATEPLAQELLADVSNMLGSENAERIYGNWQSQLFTDTKELKKCLYHGNVVILVAKGANSSLRGINIDNKRPDLIFCDDAQTKECDDSPTESAKFRKWLVAMFKIIAPRGDRTIIYVGNMYSDHCILYQLKENAQWISLVTGAILENGVPLWPELHSLEELLDSYLHDVAMGESDVWFAEVMNDPVAAKISLLNGPIPVCPYKFENEVPDGVFITIDPAGMRENSDDNVIVVHYVFDGKGITRHIEAGKKDPESLIQETLRLALAHGASVIAVEDAAYQQTLLFWFNKYIALWQIQDIHLVPLKTRNRSKEARIRLYVAELYAQGYYIHQDALAQWLWQAHKYKIGAPKNKDDILDAVAYGIDVRNEYWHLVTNLLHRIKTAAEQVLVLDNTPF